MIVRLSGLRNSGLDTRLPTFGAKETLPINQGFRKGERFNSDLLVWRAAPLLRLSSAKVLISDRVLLDGVHITVPHRSCCGKLTISEPMHSLPDLIVITPFLLVIIDG